MKPNLGYLFWRECYRQGEDKTHIENTLDKLLRSGDKEAGVEAPHGFELTVRYPGLLVGTGYSHGLKLDEDIKTGFYFDPTSGLPVIPGSSVKGTLRSLFGYPMRGEDPYAEAKHAMIRDYLGLPEDFDVAKLARAIFEGVDEKGDRIGIYERDIFYDARVVNYDKELLADDYITPHKDPLKNPVPIRILKVAPGVTFEFRFRLGDTTADGAVVSAEQKEELFVKLLSEFGVGAKTNVGYGNFEPYDPEAMQRKKAELEEKAKREQLRNQARSSDSLVDKIEAQLGIVNTAKTFLSKLKELDLSQLDEEERDRITAAIEEKFGSADKFAKKALNRIRSGGNSQN